MTGTTWGMPTLPFATLTHSRAIAVPVTLTHQIRFTTKIHSFLWWPPMCVCVCLIRILRQYISLNWYFSCWTSECFCLPACLLTAEKTHLLLAAQQRRSMYYSICLAEYRSRRYSLAKNTQPLSSPRRSLSRLLIFVWLSRFFFLSFFHCFTLIYCHTHIHSHTRTHRKVFQYVRRTWRYL